MANRNETGRDVTLQVNGQDLPITNLQTSKEHETAEDDWNDSYSVEHTQVSGSTSGSFEWAGSLPRARQAVIRDNGQPRTDLTIQINTSEETERIRGVKLTNVDDSWNMDSTTDHTVEFVGYIPNYS